MSAHTKGPWTVEDPMAPEIISIVCGEDFQSGIDIAQIGTTGDGSDDRGYLEHLANARLIAAAPDLLEALETLASYPVARGYPDGPCIKAEDMAEIRAAIAKAKGEQP